MNGRNEDGDSGDARCVGGAGDADGVGGAGGTGSAGGVDDRRNTPGNGVSGRAAQPVERVWDLPVRLLHWTLVVTVALSWYTSGLMGPAHEWLGYGVVATVLARCLWSRFGNRHARFGSFMASVPRTVAYLAAVLKGRAPRYLGHNPLGAWMVAALLSCLALLCLSGFLATTDLLWGYSWLVRLHEWLAWFLVALIGLHVAGMLWTSFAHRENLVRAMITGDKPAAGPEDID
jgi:cytochrome b